MRALPASIDCTDTSHSLTNNTRKMIDASIQAAVKQEMEGRLMPAILGAFNDLTRAVDGAAQTQAFAVRQAAIGTIKEEMAGIGPFLEQLQDSIQAQTDLIKSQQIVEEQDVPDSALEDLFLEGLRRSDAVATLVDQAPARRLLHTFPLSSQPLISNTSVMALTVKLSSSFETGSQLSSAEKKRLDWLSACIKAFPYARSDPKCAPYLPRVATMIMSGLSERRSSLVDAGDIEVCSNVIGVVDSMSYV